MLGQVIGIEPGGVEAFDLEQALAIDLVEAQPGHRLDVVEDPESQAHAASTLIAVSSGLSGQLMMPP
jgi:hypothetical protein